MKFYSLMRVICPGATALALVVGLSWASRAADTALPPPAPLPTGIPCPSCNAAPAAETPCTTCGKLKCGHKCHHPYVTKFCPGACFGYFQTQWHRWEDVCPIPYQGAGLTDAPPPPTTILSAPTPVDKKPGTPGVPGTMPPMVPVPPVPGK